MVGMFLSVPVENRVRLEEIAEIRVTKEEIVETRAEMEEIVNVIVRRKMIAIVHAIARFVFPSSHHLLSSISYRLTSCWTTLRPHPLPLHLSSPLSLQFSAFQSLDCYRSIFIIHAHWSWFNETTTHITLIPITFFYKNTINKYTYLSIVSITDWIEWANDPSVVSSLHQLQWEYWWE